MPFPFPCYMYEGTTGIAVSLLVCVIEIPRMQSIVSDRMSSEVVAVGVTDFKPLPQPEVCDRPYFNGTRSGIPSNGLLDGSIGCPRILEAFQAPLSTRAPVTSPPASAPPAVRRRLSA